MVEAAWSIVEELRDSGQYSIAEQIVEANLAQVEDRENKFNLLMLQGKIFQDQGRLEEAIEAYHKAQQLR